MCSSFREARISGKKSFEEVVITALLRPKKTRLVLKATRPMKRDSYFDYVLLGVFLYLRKSLDLKLKFNAQNELLQDVSEKITDKI